MISHNVSDKDQSIDKIWSELNMPWDKWSSKTHHGKTRSKNVSGGRTKTEGFVGKKGEGFFSHWSVTTKPNGRKSAMVGPHRDKKK